ncbi:hypothetical protein V6N13_053712 [Hibiscus sabdariffa]
MGKEEEDFKLQIEAFRVEIKVFNGFSSRIVLSGYKSPYSIFCYTERKRLHIVLDMLISKASLTKIESFCKERR